MPTPARPDTKMKAPATDCLREQVGSIGVRVGADLLDLHGCEKGALRVPGWFNAQQAVSQRRSYEGCNGWPLHDAHFAPLFGITGAAPLAPGEARVRQGGGGLPPSSSSLARLVHGHPNALRGETKIFCGHPVPSFFSRKFCRWPQPCLEPHCLFFVSTLSG